MTELKPAYHGRDHRIGGCDPIPFHGLFIDVEPFYHSLVGSALFWEPENPGANVSGFQQKLDGLTIAAGGSGFFTAEPTYMQTTDDTSELVYMCFLPPAGLTVSVGAITSPTGGIWQMQFASIVPGASSSSWTWLDAYMNGGGSPALALLDTSLSSSPQQFSSPFNFQGSMLPDPTVEPQSLGTAMDISNVYPVFTNAGVGPVGVKILYNGPGSNGGGHDLNIYGVYMRGDVSSTINNIKLS